MQAPKNLNDYIERKTYWRVLRNTYISKDKEMNKMNEMIGGIFEQSSFRGYEKTVVLYNKNKSDSHLFKLSDLQQVYGQEINGKVDYFEKDGYAIGVEDTVVSNGREYTVFDFTIVDGEIKARVYVSDEEIFLNTNSLGKVSIDKVIPLSQPKQPMTDEEMIAHLERVGKIKSGKVIV